MELSEKRMWFVTIDGFSYEQRNVLVDGEGHLLYWIDDESELNKIRPEMVGNYYPTEVQAQAEVAKNTPSDEEIMNMLSFLKHLHNLDMKRYGRVKVMIEKRYTTRYANAVVDGRYNSTEGTYDIPYRFLEIATEAIKTGYLNIDACTFRKEDVQCVKWGKDSTGCCGDPDEEFGVRLILKDGTNVDCNDWIERWLITSVFGFNMSEMEYNNVVCKNKKEDD